MNKALETRNLKKIYQMDYIVVNALNDVSLTVEKGEFIAIMGASGSGKSTLMNILGCLDKPTEGKYFLDGIDVSDLSRDTYASIRNKKLGFVFQGFNLLSRTTALDNVEVPLFYGDKKISKNEARQRSLEALKMVGLENRINHVPNKLSGGQQQRVAIARALINNPEIILADEPTGNLDTQTSVDIMKLFGALNDKGITIILVTHEPDIAAFAKRKIVMKDGRIIEDTEIIRK